MIGELAMSQILSNKAVFKDALQDWNLKWLQAILEYASSFRGKNKELILQAERGKEGL